MRNMKISQKLITSFLIVAALAAIVGAVGIMGMAQIEAADTRLYNENLIAIRAIGNMNDATSALRMHLCTLVIYETGDSQYQTADKSIDEILANVETYMSEYQNTITDDADKQTFEEIKRLYNNYMLDITIPNVRAAASVNDNEGAKLALEETATQIQSLDDLISQSAEYNATVAADMVQSNTNLYHMMAMIAVVVIAVAVLISVVLGLYVSGIISKPMVILTAFMNKAGSTGDISLSQDDIEIIGKLAQVRDEVGQCIGSTAKFIEHLTNISTQLERVANGDLTSDSVSLSETDVMGVSLEKMLNNLNKMFASIHTASEQVTSGAEQVSQGAQELASGSSQQAASIEELSASLTQLQEKTDRNATNSISAREANHMTSAKLEDSILSMGQMLNAMKEIDESATSITKVIKVIDDIAFQTNILALNAAVEAARAGQHGKGFAVVADEVRNLAGKSAEAAKETSALIEGSSERVKEGNAIVARTNADLEAAVENAKESTRLIEQVAAASTEQASSITQVNLGMEQISVVVQANAATAEQSAAASEEMSAQAVVMREVVSNFKLRQQGRVAHIGASS